MTAIDISAQNFFTYTISFRNHNSHIPLKFNISVPNNNKRIRCDWKFAERNLRIIPLGNFNQHNNLVQPNSEGQQQPSEEFVTKFFDNTSYRTDNDQSMKNVNNSKLVVTSKIRIFSFANVSRREMTHGTEAVTMLSTCIVCSDVPL